ncbi:cytochrome P450 [Amycolatopsis acidicola]|uniref:Cytochrome P450 n=2 Tax=Amycolatopsis acidicola TaxID=2596893 RepID=A0A5N0V7E0_9PSEU|nr:cytochrome P450 [Amycolatopsis acidicola]
MREQRPVSRTSANGGMFVVTRHDDIRHVARDGTVFSSAAEHGAAVVVPETAEVLAPLFERDGAPQLAWRRHLRQFFSPPASARLEPYVRGLSREIVTRLVPEGRADFVAEIAARIPLLVVGALLGLPEARRPELAATVRAATFGGEAEGRAYAGFVLELIRERRGRPDDGGLLASVVNTPIDGHEASDRELLKFVLLLIAAGNLTTTDQLASTLLVLARDHELRARVAADPALIPALVEESVRFESAVAATGRTVRAETRLNGVGLSPGDRLLLTWGSGNRDEDHFPDGASFRLDRGRVRHLGWGAGPHRCIGLHLARMQLRVICEELLAAIPEFRLPPDFVPELTYGVIRGVRSLPVTWPPPLRPA